MAVIESVYAAQLSDRGLNWLTENADRSLNLGLLGRRLGVRTYSRQGLSVHMTVPLTHERWPTQLPPAGTLEPAAR
jgi:hypothetical protein